MELEAVSGEGLQGQEGPGSRLARGVYLCCWIEQLSACHLADRLMRTLSHSLQWGEGHTAWLHRPPPPPTLIVKLAKIFQTSVLDRVEFFPPSLQLSSRHHSQLFPLHFYPVWFLSSGFLSPTHILILLAVCASALSQCVLLISTGT